MKKFIKPILLVLASLLIILAATISVALYVVFTPERISPIINRQAEKFFKCQVEIGEVELTFFSTFPKFGVKVDRFLLINPHPNAPSDTLVNIDRLMGAIDINAFRKRNEVLLSGVSIQNGFISAYIDSLGKPNFDVIVTDTVPSPREDKEEFAFQLLDMGHVELNNINLSFVDDSLNLHASIVGLYARMEGTFSEDSLRSDIKVNESVISFTHNGEKFLNNARVQLDMPLQIIQGGQNFRLKQALASVNDLEVLLDGHVELNSSNGNILTHMDYQLYGWPVKDLIALVPPSYQKHLEGVQAQGLLSSRGNISGIYSDSLMPLMDIHMIMENGSFSYTGFPLPLDRINGSIHLFTDLQNDDISFIEINEFKAHTPHSSLDTRGRVHHLFTDITSNLTTQANLHLDELQPFIPDTLPVHLQGRIQGTMNTRLSVSQVEKMQLEKVNVSGNLIAYELDLVVDSLWIQTPQSTINFTLPNPHASTPNTLFARAEITADHLETGKIDNYQAFLQNTKLVLETSDLRDTTRIPDIISTFSMDTLYASMDTIQIALKKPAGEASVFPMEGKPRFPRVHLIYNSEDIAALAGDDSALIEQLQMDVDITNDQSQPDFFLQWYAKGFVDMDQAVFRSTYITHPLEIPALKMDFDPETMNIKDSRVIIDKSDFELTGTFDNVLSYFRHDSILRGDFQFVSSNTDILELMNLTSGIGVEEERLADSGNPNPAKSPHNTHNPVNNTNDTTYSDPYMVPQGVDFLLATNIKQATLGVDTARDIRGDVRINDGILVLDDVRFTTSAAGMQLTCMYRTPRKNHLYLGLDYHMFDIEIEQLLNMIPDIDTLMPMLRSFRGTGEFHLAIESYLDSTYTIKKSTLRGASSIRGEDLVLMDGETFSEIARTLRFSKRAENRVDSLSAEFTIFREEIDIYPFLMVMDRYTAVVGGRHNFDMTFDYHISVLQSPLPFRLGIDITGDLDNLQYRPTSSRYADLYRPARRGVVQSRQLELRRMIREALMGTREENAEEE